jgi:hypothetical protein
VDLSIITVVCIFHEYKCSFDYQDGNQFGFSDRINNLELMADKQNYIILVRFYLAEVVLCTILHLMKKIKKDVESIKPIRLICCNLLSRF